MFHNYFPCHEHRVYPVIHAALWYKHSHDTLQFGFPCQCLTAVGCGNYQHTSCACSVTGLEETTNTVISHRVSIYLRIIYKKKKSMWWYHGTMMASDGNEWHIQVKWCLWHFQVFQKILSCYHVHMVLLLHVVLLLHI